MMRFNHMELTFPKGELTDQLRHDIDAFYCTIFGWTACETHIIGQMCHLLMVDDRAQQFILLAESSRPMASPGFDHLGLLQGSQHEVEDLLSKCKQFQARDPRVQIKEYEPLVNPTSTVYAFYVKYLLPIWFDVQFIDYSAAAAPPAQWVYA